MNDQTAAVVQNLATKLGTTSEYLWGVLLKQAPLQAVIDLVYIVVSVGLVAAFAKWGGPWLYSKCKDGRNDLAGICLIVGIVISVILGFAAFFTFDNVAIGFMNPEYSALNKVLAAIKAK